MTCTLFWRDDASSPAHDGSRGQAMPLFLLVILLTMTLVAFAARLGPTVDAAAQARTAADAAALAGAAGGESEARRYAELNHAVLVSFEQRGSEVVVEVVVDEVHARAAAEATWSWQRPKPKIGRVE